MNPSCTRFKQKATCPFSDGGDAIEYARVISSPSGVFAFTESHCPGTKPKRVTPLTSSSRCFVNSESETDRRTRASKVLNSAITHLDDLGVQTDSLASPSAAQKGVWRLEYDHGIMTMLIKRVVYENDGGGFI